MNPTSGLVRDLFGNYHLGATLTDDDILHAAEGILEYQLMRGGEVLTDPAASARNLKARLAIYPCEVFARLFFDNRHRAIAFEELLPSRPQEQWSGWAWSAPERGITPQCVRTGACLDQRISIVRGGFVAGGRNSRSRAERCEPTTSQNSLAR